MITERAITLRGRRIAVFVGGAGRDLVFLHGAGGLTADDPLLARLAARYRVHAPLLPGFGASEDAPELRDMLDVTLHGFDVIDALGLTRPLLVGHSMGGMIAAEMAAIAPREVENLVLIAPAGLWLESHPIPDLFAALPHHLPALLFHDVALGEKLLTGGLNLEDPQFLIGFLVRNARQLGMAGKLLFPIPDRGLGERLYRIRAETLLIWGESDRMIPPVYAEAFAAGLTGAAARHQALIPEAGHLIGAERPEAVVAALANAGF